MLPKKRSIKVMIRTGKTADGIGQGKKKNKTAESGSVNNELDGGRPSWSVNLGRFGSTDSKKGSSHQFVSDRMHKESRVSCRLLLLKAPKKILKELNHERGL